VVNKANDGGNTSSSVKSAPPPGTGTRVNKTA
jgi:hypothetical protein